jgi:hypothetical protein
MTIPTFLYGGGTVDVDNHSSGVLASETIICRSFIVRAGATVTCLGANPRIIASKFIYVELGGTLSADGLSNNAGSQPGGAGGNGGNGLGHGGAAGTASAPQAFDGLILFQSGAGTGNLAGAGGGPQAGTPGAPGGSLVLVAPTVVILGTVSSRGLPGGNATAGDCGGGGGGGGGTISLLADSLAFGASAAFLVTGGLGGAPTGAGVAGQAGGAGFIKQLEDHFTQL